VAQIEKSRLQKYKGKQEIFGGLPNDEKDDTRGL